jgi:translation initiation factor IF-2
MAGKLIKVAKEFNVGLHTIVEFLSSKGFTIDGKPTATVSDEMYAILRDEYQGSADIKEKADQITIGSYKKVEDKSSGLPEIPKFIKPQLPNLGTKTEEKATTPEVEIPEPDRIEKEEKPVLETITEEEPVSKSTTEMPGLKVVGKIDLDKKPQKRKEIPEEIEEIIPEEKEITAEAPKESKESETVITEQENNLDESVIDEKGEKAIEDVVSPTPEIDAQSTDEDDEFRAKTPQLAGLKIMGKIDASKLNSGSKPVKKEKPKPERPAAKKDTSTPATGEAGKTTGEASDEVKKKRKRKRKKVVHGTESGTGTSSGPQGNKARKDKEEPKEVSQKEIEEKIKATMARLAGGGKGKRQKIRRDNRDLKREKQSIADDDAVESKLKITEFVSVSELASLMDVPVTDVITTCMNLGVIVSINQRLDAEVIELVAGEFNFEIEFTNPEEELNFEAEAIDEEKDLLPRAPIVTVMGHVDHGKTSLLDYIRKANVVSGEAGGITQHIGAYEVLHEGQKVTFLDTPGHEAFTAMRARGAKVTDIVVVIIAADDRIMPQTKEAISHAQAAGVPIIFAINKIDKDGADPEKIKNELASMNLLIEEWGGTYQSQDISAKAGTNIDLLLEKILLQAEVLELKANPNRAASGAVIEAALDKGKGYVCKILVQIGTLKVGDAMVAGPYSGKVKAMFNEKGKRIKEAGPSSPVMILGLSGAPQAGEKVRVVDNEQEARQIALKRSQIERELTNRASKRISLDEIGRRLALGNFKELNLIVKGDVDGSIEALSDSLIKLSVESIQVNVIHKAVGAISESDVLLASASDAIIIGFQVRPSAGAKAVAEREGVEIKIYSIIYEAIEHIKAAMEGMLDTIKEEKVVGVVEVREIYKISKVGTIAGCFVREGKITRNSGVRVIRDGIVIFPNKEGAFAEISSLKRFKEDVREVKSNLECGLSIKNFNNIDVGDMIESYEIIETKQTLD